MNKPNTNFFLK